MGQIYFIASLNFSESFGFRGFFEFLIVSEVSVRHNKWFYFEMNMDSGILKDSDSREVG